MNLSFKYFSPPHRNIFFLAGKLTPHIQVKKLRDIQTQRIESVKTSTAINSFTLAAISALKERTSEASLQLENLTSDLSERKRKTEKLMNMTLEGN